MMVPAWGYGEQRKGESHGRNVWVSGTSDFIGFPLTTHVAVVAVK